MKKIIETVAENGSELGVHVYPSQCCAVLLDTYWCSYAYKKVSK